MASAFDLWQYDFSQFSDNFLDQEKIVLLFSDNDNNR